MVQRADIIMRLLSIVGGIVAFIDAILVFFNSNFMPWDFGWISGVIGILLAIAVVFLGIKPIHYIPFLLVVIGIALIVLGLLYGGIIVLVAAYFGFLS